MALFKKKPAEDGAKEWEQTLVAEDTPPDGDSEFKFKLGKGEEESDDSLFDDDAPEPATDDAIQEDDILSMPGDEEAVNFDEPQDAPAALDPDQEVAVNPPWDDEDGPDAFTAEDMDDPAEAVRMADPESGRPRMAAPVGPESYVYSWTPRHRETIARIEKLVDEVTPYKPKPRKALGKWLTATAEDDSPEGEGMELIPSNIRSKKIVYETEGGFVVEVMYREAGDLRRKYFTVSSTGGRTKALASIKSGTYAKVTTVTDSMIEALKAPGRRKGGPRASPGKIKTWPIENTTNVTDVEGIGDEYQGRLKEIGFYTTDQLRLGNPAILAAHLGTTEANVQYWQQQAELMLVKGVGKQQAELLVRAGVRSIKDLKALTPKKLTKMIDDVAKGRKVRISGRGIGPKTAATLIREARKLRPRLQPFPELGPRK
jgi:predicted flap endonuclease-1-like 5' DNA nuclease